VADSVLKHCLKGVYGLEMNKG